MTDPLKALFGKPDYSHIVRDTTATISITAAEMTAKWPLRGCTPAPTLRVGKRPLKRLKSLQRITAGLVWGLAGFARLSPCRAAVGAGV